MPPVDRSMHLIGRLMIGKRGWYIGQRQGERQTGHFPALRTAAADLHLAATGE